MFVLRQVSLVEAEQDDVLEVEVAGFEHSHDLYAFGGFAVERYFAVANHL